MLIDLAVAPLFPDMIQCMAIQVLEIKKSKSCRDLVLAEGLTCLSVCPTVVYLYLINYARSKSDEIAHAIPGFLSVSTYWTPFCPQLNANSTSGFIPQDCNDRNPLIRALAVRTMSSITSSTIISALIDPLRNALQDTDPYVRKTAAIR